MSLADLEREWNRRKRGRRRERTVLAVVLLALVAGGVAVAWSYGLLG